MNKTNVSNYSFRPIIIELIYFFILGIIVKCLVVILSEFEIFETAFGIMGYPNVIITSFIIVTLIILFYVCVNSNTKKSLVY